MHTSIITYLHYHIPALSHIPNQLEVLISTHFHKQTQDTKILAVYRKKLINLEKLVKINCKLTGTMRSSGVVVYLYVDLQNTEFYCIINVQNN